METTGATVPVAATTDVEVAVLIDFIVAVEDATGTFAVLLIGSLLITEEVFWFDLDDGTSSLAVLDFFSGGLSTVLESIPLSLLENLILIF